MARLEMPRQEQFEEHLRTIYELIRRAFEAMNRGDVEVSPSVAFSLGQLAGSLAGSLDHQRMIQREMTRRGIV